MDKRINMIADKIGEENILIQLAEEAAELSQACLKCVRCERGLTPKTPEEVLDNLAEEIADVQLCSEMILEIFADAGIKQNTERYRTYKLFRWFKRTFLGGK